ncbi:hypothetical protein AZE42_05702 [Rhizopogon vesiculosus]|uniref:MYND-type domain-containing protein n=1 Tax=Rhizopogon vesiculosus TaxID=180088 RepID=A0A1J8PS72_9AGAM|nr:hypothetical protein AZE42_05702 [Rhizopogon vesiculosus]
MALTAKERTALRSLPKRIQVSQSFESPRHPTDGVNPPYFQRLVDGALRGSVYDVRQLNNWVGASTNVELNMTLLPIFYTHLDPNVIPDQLLPTKDVQEVVTLAKWSLRGIVRVCSGVIGALNKTRADSIITDALVRRWDVLFPWMQFIYRHFLPGTPQNSHEGCSIVVGEAVDITSIPLHQMASCSVAGHNLIQTNIAVQQFISKLWLYIGKLKDGDLHGGTEGVGAGQARGAIVRIITLCMDPLSQPSTLHTLVDAAGGYEPFVASALRYTRWFGRNLGDIPRSNIILSPTGPDYISILTTLVIALSTSVRFIRLVSIADPTCREKLILHGAPSNVVTALLQAWPTVSVMRENVPMENLAAVKSSEMLEGGFGYTALALLRTEACIPAACQVLDAGFIELVLQTGFRCSRTASGVLMLIPRFFMYHKVLSRFQKALDRTEDDATRLQFLARKNEEVQKSWASVHQAAQQILDICAKTNALPFYEQKCASVECPCDANEHPHYRCSGCLIARYCSRGCQRRDWKSRHRTSCRVLHSAAGINGSKHIRCNLPLITLVETFNYALYADRIQDAMEQARGRYPDETDRLVLETDLSAFPVTFSARPVQEYYGMFDSRFEPTILKELRGLPGKHILMTIKLKAGQETCVILSPRVALKLAFQWPGTMDEQAGNEIDAWMG